MPKGVYARTKENTKNLKGRKMSEKQKMFLSESRKGNGNPMHGKIPWNKNLKGFLLGDKNPAWKGGRIISGAGYVLVYKPDHSYHNYHGSHVFEHRLVMEKFLGRLLNKKEVVHHINGVKDDNRIENLELLENQVEHMKIHYSLHKY